MNTEKHAETSGRAKKPSQNRERLITIAQEKFGQKGFAETGTEEIVASAGVTRGVLYYQFVNKEDLFRAVFERTIVEIGQVVYEKTMAQASRESEELLIGTQVMLDIFSGSRVKQIVLLDGPNVLGWATWNAIQRPLHLALITHALEHLVDEGLLAVQPLEPLADIIAGAAMQASLAIATSAEPEKTREIYRASLSEIITSLSRSTS